MAKVQKKRFTSPTGKAIYPRVNTADTKYDANGKYSIKLALSKEEPSTQKLADFIQKRYDDYIARVTAEAKGKRVQSNPPPFDDEYDTDGNETGNILFNFSSIASGTNKKTGKSWARKIDLFDAKGKVTDVDIWSGSEVKVAFTMREYLGGKTHGLTLDLEAVQVIELVNGSSQSASAGQYGFGEEDGFEDSGETSDDFGSSEDNSGETSDDEDGSDF